MKPGFECRYFWRRYQQSETVCVCQPDRFYRHRHGGLRPVAVDLVGFFRPRLYGPVGKHYTSQADNVLPALVFGMVAAVGSVDKTRLPLLR